MGRATTLIQMPHGLVAVAISLAVLPTLSRLTAVGDWAGFHRTLGVGLRLVLVLIIPATMGLLVLSQPIIALLFEHGMFTATDTFWTAWALRYYLVGLVFAAIDWPLNYSFYARQDTLTPALVGVLSVAVYLVVALVLLQPLGFLGLVLADSAKHMSHALTMLILTRRHIGTLAELGLGRATVKAVGAGGAMTMAMILAMSAVQRLAGTGGLLAVLFTVLIVGAVGLLVYGGLATLLRVEEVGLLWAAVRERLGRSNLD
jgi:putative peptidoglycan lipid II flippase